MDGEAVLCARQPIGRSSNKHRPVLPANHPDTIWADAINNQDPFGTVMTFAPGPMGERMGAILSTPSGPDAKWFIPMRPNLPFDEPWPYSGATSRAELDASYWTAATYAVYCQVKRYR